MKNQQTLTKLEKLEKELLKIKKGGEFKFHKKIISLKGIEISEGDIQKIKESFW
jgi:hypothetical protein